MPGTFRRAQLRGSDELFRPTRPDEDVAGSPSPPAARGGGEDSVYEGRPRPPHSDAALGVVRPEGRLVRLTDEEVDILIDAIQKLKYPTATKLPTKPPMDVHERLEELRQKIISAR